MPHIEAGLVLTIISIIAALAGFARWLYSQFRSLDALLDDWHGEPDRPGVPGRLGVMERLDNIERKVNCAAFNSRPNHGSSAYDEHTRLLNEIIERMDDKNA